MDKEEEEEEDEERLRQLRQTEAKPNPMPQTVQIAVISGNVVPNQAAADSEMDALLLGRTKVSRN